MAVPKLPVPPVMRMAFTNHPRARRSFVLRIAVARRDCVSFAHSSML